MPFSINLYVTYLSPSFIIRRITRKTQGYMFRRNSLLYDLPQRAEYHEVSSVIKGTVPATISAEEGLRLKRLISSSPAHMEDRMRVVLEDFRVRSERLS